MHDPDLSQRAYEPILRWAREAPARVAFTDSARRALTYGEFASAIDAAAELLIARGIRAGDRVLIVGENSLGGVVLMFAAQRIDAWPAMVNARVSAREIAAMGDAAAARVKVFVVEDSPAAATHAAEASAESADLPGCGRIAFGPVDPAAEAEPVHADGARQVGLLLFTSGTTGKPKAVMLSHRALLNIGRSGCESRGVNAGDCLYGLSPLSHVMGAAFFVMVSITAGAATRLVPRLDLPDLVAALCEKRITFLMAVPTLYVRLLDYAAQQAVDLSKHGLKNLIAGGAPLDPALKQRIEDLFGMPVANGLAMTECCPVLRTPAGVYCSPESVGVPQGGVEVRLTVNGKDVPPGKIGELWVRGPSLMLGYYRDADANARAFKPGGWFATGDLLRRLDNGEYSLVGRQKELIIHSGFNVYPGEVEFAISAHPAIAQCAVVGHVVGGGNEEVVAFIQLQPGQTLSTDDLRAYLARQIAPYKIPGRVVMLDNLPIGPTGKIFKSKLAEMAAAFQ
jgi:acyl-CoA synthetase (AMP-forming)/AMP-acid ligase II